MPHPTYGYAGALQWCGWQKDKAADKRDYTALDQLERDIIAAEKRAHARHYGGADM